MKHVIGIKSASSTDHIACKTMQNLILISLMFLLSFCSTLFAEWQPDVRLTYNDSLSLAALNNARGIAVHGDTLHVVWFDWRDGNSEIYYKRSTNRGTTWGDDARLTNAPDSSKYPSVAVSGEIVHVVWIDCRDGNSELYYKRSTNGGTTWEDDTRCTYDAFRAWRPSNAVSGDNVHVVWEDYLSSSILGIYYIRSTNGGTSWKLPVRLSNSLYLAARPSVTVVGDSVHVVWCDDRNGNSDIYYRRSTDAGASWGTDIQLTDDPYDAFYCSVAASGNNVYAFWSDLRSGIWNIYYNRSTNGGTTWGTDTMLTDDPNTSMVPASVASGNNVHVVWSDWRDDNWEVYYKRSTVGGSTWEADTGLTSDTARSVNPSVVVSGSYVHVIWSDGRDGNREIYYKRDPTGNPGGVETRAFETSDQLFLVRPTVFNNRILLRFKEYSAMPLKIALYNIYGAAVFEQSYSDTPHSLIIEDVAIRKLPPSVYFLSVSSNKRQIAWVKLIKL